jgi:hypothetical protein
VQRRAHAQLEGEGQQQRLRRKHAQQAGLNRLGSLLLDG